MNPYGIIILAALLADFALNLVTDVLNLRAAQAGVPPEFQGIYDPEAYAKSQAYLRARTRVGFVADTTELVLLLAFWFAGGFGALDRLVRGWQLHPVLTGLAYIGILLLGKALLSLPFSAYGTFVIERRFGFNRTTLGTFVADLLKGLLLAVVLGGPLLAGVLAVLEYAGPPAWLYCWGVVTAFSLALQFVAPIWVLPLFNRFTPLPEGELRSAILDYTTRVRFPVGSLFAIDGSRRSTHTNAYVAGFGRLRRIALFDTLIIQHTVPELVAVVAHEVGHWRKCHVLLGLALGVLQVGFMLFLLSRFLQAAGLFAAFGVERPSTYAALVFFGLLYTPVALVFSLMLHWVSRRHEFAADRFAAVSTGSPGPMVDAMRKLSRDNLSNLTPHPLAVWLHYSHPPVLDRIRALAGGQSGCPAPGSAAPPGLGSAVDGTGQRG
jgi:STE24 endopeptidase